MYRVQRQLSRSEWEPGSLSLFTAGTNDPPRVELQPDKPEGTQPVQLPLNTITSHQQSKKRRWNLRLVGGSPSIALVLAFADEQSKQAFSEELQLALSSSSLSQSSNTSSDAAARSALLKSDPSLQRVHAQLVESGAVSEDEFWSERQHMLEQAHGRAKGSSCDQPREKHQRTGIVSSMEHISHESHDMTRSFRLTKQQMQQIFTEQPAVRRAYLDNVPATMTEQDFWSYYFQAETLRQVRRHTGPLNQKEQKVLDMFADNNQLRKQAMTRRMNRVDPSVNLALNQHDQLLPGYGTAHAGHKDEWSCEGAFFSQGKAVGDVIRNVNTHGEAALDGPPANDRFDSAAAAKDAERRVQQEANMPESEQVEALGRHYKELERELHINELGWEGGLNEPKSDHSQASESTINVTNPRLYFVKSREQQDDTNGQQRQNKRARTFSAEEIECQVRSAQDAYAQSALDSDGALTALSELSREASGTRPTDSMDMAGRAEPLSFETRRLLQCEQQTVHELLRHFWKSVPATTPSKRDKLEKLMSTAQQCRQRIDETKASLQPAQRHSASVATRPLLQAIDAAFEQLDRECFISEADGSGEANGASMEQAAGVVT
jgi:transcription initiation factor TFIIH subunit 1